jgi:hypothetical protein
VAGGGVNEEAGRRAKGLKQCFQALVFGPEAFVLRESFPKLAVIRTGCIAVVVVHSVTYWGTYLNLNRLRAYSTLDWKPVLLSRHVDGVSNKMTSNPFQWYPVH